MIQCPVMPTDPQCKCFRSRQGKGRVTRASYSLTSTFEGTFIPGLLAMFGKPLATLLLTLAAVELISAVALTRAGLWSRYPLRFISFLLLFAFPIGTSVAIYTFWAMRGLTNQPALSNR